MGTTVDVSSMPFGELLTNSESSNFETSNQPKRKRLFTPKVSLIALLNQISNKRGSCQDAVNSVYQACVTESMSECSLNTAAYCKAREKILLEPLKDLNDSIIQSEEADSKWLWNGRKVVLLDGSTSTTADTKENLKLLPLHGTQKEGCGYPLARYCVLSELETGFIKDIELGPFSGKGSSELSLGLKLLDRVEPGTAVAADCFFLSYAFFCKAMNKNIDLICPKKNKNFSCYERTPIGPDDYLVTVKKPRIPHTGTISKEEYEALPDQIILRETWITLCKNGFRNILIKVISTFTDSDKYSTQSLADLSAARWNIEVDFRILKKELDLEFIPCKKPETVMKYIWATFIVFNLIRRLTVLAAKMFEKKPRGISFRSALNLYQRFSGKLADGAIQNKMLKAIGAITVGKQPNRFEPRAVKKANRNNSFPKISMKRDRWRLVQITPELLDLGFSKSMEEAILGLADLIPKNTKGVLTY